jgi:hypothetical protein
MLDVEVETLPGIVLGHRHLFEPNEIHGAVDMSLTCLNTSCMCLDWMKSFTSFTLPTPPARRQRKLGCDLRFHVKPANGQLLVGDYPASAI